MNNKILTISVAAYNLEKYIKECLDSFANCKYLDKLEILVTNDGSTDKTAEIVSEYEKKFPYSIKLINQRNAGAGSTVNSGIKHATGKFFRMVDGDDWVNSNNLDDLILELEKCDSDIVVCDYIVHNDYDNTNQKFSFNSKNGSLDFSEFIKNNYLQMHAVILKTSILKNNKITLDNGFYTDVEYLLLPIKYLKTCYYYNDKPIYIYRVGREGQSISVKSYQKNLDMHELVLKRLVDNYEINKGIFSDNVKEYYLKRISTMAWVNVSVLLSFKANEVKQFIKTLSDSSNDIYDYFSKNTKAKYLIKSNYVLLYPMSFFKKILTK